MQCITVSCEKSVEYSAAPEIPGYCPRQNDSKSWEELLMSLSHWGEVIYMPVTNISYKLRQNFLQTGMLYWVGEGRF